MYGTEEVEDVFRPSTFKSPKLFIEEVAPLLVVLAASGVAATVGATGTAPLMEGAIEDGLSWEGS